jgi:hypothetical protein
MSALVVVAAVATVLIAKPWRDAGGDAPSRNGGAAVEDEPEEPDATLELLALGSEHLTAGAYDEAIAAFTSALELDGELAEALIGRGDAYAGLARYGDAAEDYGRALELDGGDGVAEKLGAAQNAARRVFVADSLKNGARALTALPSPPSESSDYAFSASVAAEAPSGYLTRLYYELTGEEAPSEFAALFDILGASKVWGTVATDADSRLLGVRGAWQVDARDILTASAVISEDELYFTIPELFPTAVQMPIYSYELSEMFSALFDGGGAEILAILSDLPLEAMLADVIDAALAELTFGEEKDISVYINGSEEKFDAITLELTQTDAMNAGIAALTVLRGKEEYIAALARAAEAYDDYLTEDAVRDALDRLKEFWEEQKTYYAGDEIAFRVKLLIGGPGGFSGVLASSDHGMDAGIAWKLGTGYEFWLEAEDEMTFQLYGDLTLSGLSLSGTVNIYYEDYYGGESISGKLLSFADVSVDGGTAAAAFSDLAALKISAGDDYTALGAFKAFLDEGIDYLADASLNLTFASDGDKATAELVFRLDDSASVAFAFSGEPKAASLSAPSDVGYYYYDFDEFLYDLDAEDIIGAFDVVSARLGELGYNIDALWSLLRGTA